MSKGGLHRNHAVATLPFGDVCKPIDETGLGARMAQQKKGGKFSLTRIQTEIDQIREEASIEGREMGYQEGYAYGMRTGKKAGAAEAMAEAQAANEQFLAGLDEIATDAQRAMNEWFALAEDQLAGLAVVIAERILAREIETSKDIVSALAKECMSEISHASTARVLVNLANFAAVKGREAELMSLAPTVKNVEIACDPSMDHGVVVDTEGGRIDAQIRTMLTALKTDILEAA